ncbi:MAG: diguanylate cyclase [Roseburia sp.]|nr:diguanylate cyclase [Roseburia sp.]MCM1280179.1 diguanylate cyclase [Robinsoniella sp.]
MKKVQGSLYFSLILMTSIPLMGFAIIMLGYATSMLKAGMEEEVEEALRNLGISVVETYETAYPGDYGIDQEGHVVKGEHVLYGEYSLIDHIKEETGVEVSLIYEDTRMLTTIRNKENKRIGGTAVSDMVLEHVLDKGEEFFSKDLSISGEKYYGYYLPLINSDGEVTGMLFVGKQQKEVNGKVNRMISQILIIGLAALILAVVFSIVYTKNIINAINKMMEFLRKVATGDLSAKQDEKLFARNDEIGEMGRLALSVQQSLRTLIERDGLTNLYNRRSGERKLKELEKKAKESDAVFSIALGDIDFFKKFNDDFGHECGDVVLKKVAECLRQHMADYEDYAIRWGGEEFLLIFMGLDEKKTFSEAEKILSGIQNMKVTYGSKEVSVTMTLGVTEYRKNETIDRLVKRADDSLYKGKALGRNRVVAGA